MEEINDKNTVVLTLIILTISLFLNMYGIWWGLPMEWHPDELVRSVVSMAKNLDPNPHNFVYPSFHRYVLGIVLSPYFVYAKLSSLRLSQESAIITVYLISRLISAIMGTLTVFFTYFIGKEVYNKKVGLISSSFLACSMGFVNLSHFATVDIPLTFWIAVSIFFFVKIVKTGQMKHYLLAGLFAGLASSTKYTALLLILPMFVSHLISQKWYENSSFDIFSREIYVKLIKISFHKKIISGAVMMIIGFIIGTPYSLLDFSTFKRDLFYIVFRKYDVYFYEGENTWMTFTLNLKNAMGLPLLLICSFGILYLMYKWSKKDENEFNKSKYFVILLSWIIPYSIIVGSWTIDPMRYTIPIIPILTIFGGTFVYEMVSSSIHSKRNIMYVFLCLILIYSFSYSFAADYMLIHDSRYAAGEWFEKNVAINSTIEVYQRHNSCLGFTTHFYLPSFPKNVKIFYAPCPSIGNHINQTYIEQYDNFLKGLEERKPDYIVLTSRDYLLYLNHRDLLPYRTMFFSNLIYGNSNYTICASFGNETIGNRILQTIERPNPEFVNPTILILKRNIY